MFLGKLMIFCGPMFAGKTTKLIKITDKAKKKGQSVILFKYQLDTRYSDKQIASHDNVFRDAIPCQHLMDQLSLCENHDVIGIDEGQFFDDLYIFIEKVIQMEKTVLISFLDGDYLRRPFGQTLHLLPMCDYFVKLNAKSLETGEIGSYTMRIVKSDLLTLIGGNESYKPVSRSTYKNISTNGSLNLIISKKADRKASDELEKRLNGFSHNENSILLISNSSKLHENKQKYLKKRSNKSSTFKPSQYIPSSTENVDINILQDSYLNQKNTNNNVSTFEITPEFLDYSKLSQFDVIAIENRLTKKEIMICDKLADDGKTVIIASFLDGNKQTLKSIINLVPLAENVTFLNENSENETEFEEKERTLSDL
ncbi:thymidine kinase family protein [Tritrichomonas foetus]|uniref:thymidine kinase n=1 Tax=Tritrichomonas foetus TaxID=1144522 RepID=A0A1J4KJ67_9EUKA|nr:thymidine kinase family protein [Tritrichomonas foetus]|eukprot:OHT11267.1 thymidine kinase family protein [Tritrichomonas foetus]